jgi:hypothetical protein
MCEATDDKEVEATPYFIKKAIGKKRKNTKIRVISQRNQNFFTKMITEKRSIKSDRMKNFLNTLCFLWLTTYGSIL